MTDFLKIFGVLCIAVAAFLFGQNHGDQKFRNSEEYQSIIKEKTAAEFNKNEFENLKTKFQNIVDTSETKKTEELLAQILQVFLADLGLRIQNQQAFLKPTAPIVPAATLQPKAAPLPVSNIPQKTTPTERAAVADVKKFHSYEWMLANSQNKDDVRRNLKNIEIKDMDQFLKTSTLASPQQMQSIFGSYRGRIYDSVNKKEYATMALKIVETTDAGKPALTGSIKLFKNGREDSTQNFTTDQLGYSISGSTGFIINSATDRYFQLYKITETQQIAGYYYERATSSGRTRTIGSFTLNRVDQF